MNERLALVNVILGGFFAVACIRACVPKLAGKIGVTDFVRFPGRIERLQRTRWQWFSMVALLLVLRLQGILPLVSELIVAIEFAVFLAVPTSVKSGGDKRGGGDAAFVAGR